MAAAGPRVAAVSEKPPYPRASRAAPLGRHPHGSPRCCGRRVFLRSELLAAHTSLLRLRLLRAVILALQTLVIRDGFHRSREPAVNELQSAGTRSREGRGDNAPFRLSTPSAVSAPPRESIPSPYRLAASSDVFGISALQHASAIPPALVVAQPLCGQRSVDLHGDRVGPRSLARLLSPA